MAADLSDLELPALVEHLQGTLTTVVVKVIATTRTNQGDSDEQR